MTMPNFHTPRTWIITSLCAAAVGGSAWAVFRSPNAKAGGVAIPRELSVESLKAKAQEPDKLRETMRETMRRDDLTDEQRRQIAENMRAVELTSLEPFLLYGVRIRITGSFSVTPSGK